ncbi:phage shock protein C (PspC) family protein [Jatrophihabitans sp. GAS493]|uniref:ATP-binding protein n=1 Tax=Jatrophihabitans sp. GAS493 TaxID=1907575 RepID=UPI000BB9B040|nr:ATP-binding protein [Jatrophihabitans sp. GAS493]SOD70351.1 phage shock protein C (PspC) family protein [Jatrophihabitans sp. GAS493]
MVTTTLPETAGPVRAEPQRKLYRRADHRYLSGVAGGIADHLGLSAVAIRAVFVVLTASGGLGPVLYAVFWIVLPTPPGTKQRTRWWVYLAAGVACAIGIGLTVWTMPLGRLFVPSVLALVGGALIWRQASETQRAQWWSLSRRSLTAANQTGRLRLLAGVLLVIVGCVVVIARADFSAMRDGLVAVLVTVVGIGLITGPWWVGMVTELGAERTERIRSQERAEIAARLHDSVLQTLALIQRNANSPREVTRLARGQERELRNLLYGPDERYGQLAKALTDAAAEIEDAYAITVDAVVVGDTALDDSLRALVASAREALQNAAKHAKVTEVSLYAEVEESSVVVYVRDRGVGFALDEVADDRQGVRGSIIARVERHGGTATIRSAAGDGTEVAIRMPVSR